MIPDQGDCGWAVPKRAAIADCMNDRDAEDVAAEPTDWTAPEIVEVASRRDDCQRHIAQRVIAALRRGGVNCCVVLTDQDEPH